MFWVLDVHRLALASQISRLILGEREIRKRFRIRYAVRTSKLVGIVRVDRMRATSQRAAILYGFSTKAFRLSQAAIT